MKLFLLTALTMVSFAANSLLNRAALAEGVIGPANFASIRVASGVFMLLFLLALRDHHIPRPASPSWGAIAGLSAYMLGFSYAYVSLDAGLGALILFGGVQITMFAGGVIGGDKPPVVRWAGMFLSMGGLALLFWPSDYGAIHLGAYLLMTIAALGWGIYSLMGRTVTDPLHATAWNFTYSLPIVVAALLLNPDTQSTTQYGVMLAIISGAVTSGLGYALWYSVLPRLGATVGALSQLSVAVIALVLGAFLLNEEITSKGIVASALVLGGIGIGILGAGLKKKRQR